MKIQVLRPRVGQVLEFDYDTKEDVSTVIDDGEQSDILCNVTKHNILTGYGRLLKSQPKTQVSLKFKSNKAAVSIRGRGKF